MDDTFTYRSTRDAGHRVSISQAITNGLAPDGGLYIPVMFPAFEFEDFLEMESIEERAVAFLKPFFAGDPLAEHLESICKNTFSFPIPLEKIDEDLSVLELYHGPTGAFKDVGAKFLAECFGHLESNHTILVATSGDTGSAVASAFHGQPGINVVILYPKNKISDFQKNQMIYWGENVIATEVAGDFDDCQRMVKIAFESTDISQRYSLSSANSINIGRLLPQCIYYIQSCLQYYKETGEPANYIVPTGNMGNVLACIWVKHMGFPVGRIAIATNENKTIPIYFATGSFDPTSSIPTLANAMDVGNPSNMERFLDLVEQFPSITDNITALSVNDMQIRQMIAEIFNKFQKKICPHTATAFWVRQNRVIRKSIIVATAHPYKFKEIVGECINNSVDIPHQLRKFLETKSTPREIGPTVDELLSLLEELFD